MTEYIKTHTDAVSEYYKLKNKLNLSPEEKVIELKTKEKTNNDAMEALKAENEYLKGRIKELESSPPVDLKEIKRRLQDEIDSLYYKLQAIELLESEWQD